MSESYETISDTYRAEIARWIGDELGYRDRKSIIGIALYTQNSQTVLYRDETQTAAYSPADIDEILEHARLETIGLPAVENLHQSSLRASIRLYEDLNTIVVPADRYTGLVIAHRSGFDETVSDIATEVADVLTSPI